MGNLPTLQGYRPRYALHWKRTDHRRRRHQGMERSPALDRAQQDNRPGRYGRACFASACS